MAVQLWLSAQEANSNSLHLDIRVLTLKFASFENRLCAITPVSAIFLLLAWSRPNPTDWSSFLLATRLPAPLPGWSTCRCRCFCQWYGHLDDRSKSLTRSPTAVCPLLPDLHIAPPRARLVDWVRLSIVGARNSRGCAGWTKILLISLPPFFLTFGHRSNTETQCNYISMYAHDSNGLSSSVCVVMLVGSMSGLVALTSWSVPDLQLVKRMF